MLESFVLYQLLHLKPYLVLLVQVLFEHGEEVDSYYSPECDRGIAFDDNELNIDWKLSYNQLNLSAKDKVQPLLKDTNDLFEYGVDYYA